VIRANAYIKHERAITEPKDKSSFATVQADVHMLMIQASRKSVCDEVFRSPNVGIGMLHPGRGVVLGLCPSFRQGQGHFEKEAA
jgi:hypothetical protein